MSEKRKKSWKEIDRQRDRSQHRRDEPQSGGRGRRGGDPSRSHRAALDQLFSSGKISELVKQRDEETGVTPDQAGPTRRELGERVQSAPDKESKIAAIEAYLEAFPRVKDFEVLAHVLDHPDDEVVEDALEQIAALLEEETPRRPRTLIAQLKNVAELNEWGRLRKRAKAILETL